jgi:hypothetical protein
VADRPLKAADLLGALPWFDVCPVWQAAKRAAAAAYAKQRLRELAISVTMKLNHDSAARNKDPYRLEQMLQFESGPDGKIWIQMIGTQPIAIEER